MKTVVITCGRNVGDEPMTAELWHWFKASTTSRVRSIPGATALQYPNLSDSQVGEWEGQTEDAFAIVALVPDGEVASLRNWLREACVGFKQEAIGFIEADGVDNLITP